MKMPQLLLLATLAVAGRAAAVESAIPDPFPAERYTAMLEKSPFALATPPAPPPAAPVKGFASDWYVSGLGQYEEKDFVSIKSRDLATSFSLYGTEEANGVTLVGVEWSNERGKSTVTIKKDSEIARLEFNQADVLPPAAPMPGAPGVGQAGAQVRPVLQGQAGARPVVTPLQPQLPVTNQPGGQARISPPSLQGGSRMTIPRPTGAPVVNQVPTVTGTSNAAGPAPVSNDPNGGDNRRRIRVINPKP
jgi:hypothetical protein